MVLHCLSLLLQGETIAENFGIIFEFGSNPDWRWVYVALSRASSLKQAWFYDGEPLLKRKKLGVRIREKLASYKEQDEKAGRAPDKFITEKWVMERVGRRWSAAREHAVSDEVCGVVNFNTLS